MKYAPILQIVKKPNVQKDIPKSVKDSMNNVPTFMMMEQVIKASLMRG